jgi:hypothetical protein
MAVRTISVDLEEDACTLALGPYVEGLSLLPESRAAIESGVRHPTGLAYRSVTCTVDGAWDMLDYFRNGADALTIVHDARAPICARAFDNVRHALRVAGHNL